MRSLQSQVYEFIDLARRVVASYESMPLISCVILSQNTELLALVTSIFPVEEYGKVGLQVIHLDRGEVYLTLTMHRPGEVYRFILNESKVTQ